MYKTAFDVVNETFDKVAGVKTDKVVDVLNGLGTKTKKAGSKAAYRAKKMVTDVTEIPYNLNNVKSAIKAKNMPAVKHQLRVASDKAFPVAILAGTTQAGVAGAKALKNRNEEKTACDIVSEVFEKQAKFKMSKAKNVLSGKNIKDAVNGLKQVNAVGGKDMFPDSVKMLKEDIVREAGKTLGSYTGMAGATGAGVAGAKALKNKKTNNEEE